MVHGGATAEAAPGFLLMHLIFRGEMHFGKEHQGEKEGRKKIKNLSLYRL